MAMPAPIASQDVGGGRWFIYDVVDCALECLDTSSTPLGLVAINRPIRHHERWTLVAGQRS